ncbi:FAD-dependent oxidoreductase [Actinomycetes bacterium KLBMP 9797]
MRTDGPVLVVGGGIVGLCVAHYLTTAGVEVEVAERATLASGASWGNAGWVCLSHSTPVPFPGVARYGLRSLGRPDAPLYLRPSADPRFVAWLWRLWRSSGEAAFRRGYAAIADLNRPTFALYDGLAGAGVDTTLRRPGLVHAFLSEVEAAHHLATQRIMAAGRYDLPDDIVVGEAAHGLDPALGPHVRAAYLVRGEGVVDPRRLVESLAGVVREAGGKIHEHVEVRGFHGTAGRIGAAVTSTGEIPCSAVVIAGGMWSHRLLRHLGYRLPLQAGKGYSFTVPLPDPPRRALYLGEHRVVAGALRAAARPARPGGPRRAARSTSASPGSWRRRAAPRPGWPGRWSSAATTAG